MLHLNEHSSDCLNGSNEWYHCTWVRIGLDAMHRLEAQPRDLDVTYYNGSAAPCPCVVDGIMIATISTPGQNSLRVASVASPPQTFGMAEIRHKRTGQTLRYIIPSTAQAVLDEWNRDTTGRQRYDAVINAPEADLFSVEANDRNEQLMEMKHQH